MSTIRKSISFFFFASPSRNVRIPPPITFNALIIVPTFACSRFHFTTVAVLHFSGDIENLFICRQLNERGKKIRLTRMLFHVVVLYFLRVKRGKNEASKEQRRREKFYNSAIQVIARACSEGFVGSLSFLFPSKFSLFPCSCS